MESLKSVSENPFFKHFGMKHNGPLTSRRNHRSQTPEQQGSDHKDMSLSSTTNDEDDIVEYRPVSGFVNKLLDKFSSLNTREEQVSYSSLKKFSSLDQLLDDKEATTDTHKVATGTSSSLDRPSKLATQKSKSIENLTNAHLKPQQYNRHGVSLQNSDKNVNRYKDSTSSKFQRDHDLARHDIIIIEKTPSVPLKGSKNEESAWKNASLDVASKYDNLTDEMPKPNTVLTVRTIFENASQTDLYLRRRRSDQPLSPSSPSFKASLLTLQTEQSTFDQDGASKRNSLQSSSPITSPRYGGETLSKPVLLPSSATFRRQSDYSRHPSDSHLPSKPEDIRSLTPNSPVSPGTNYYESLTSQRENSSSLSVSNVISQPAGDNRAPTFEGVKAVDSTKPSGSQHHLSRSTASVKPTINNKQNAPVKPVPLSAPASSTTTYLKSRPVVSVAPYREKPEDGKSSEHPTNISTDSKLSNRGDKLQQTVFNAQLNNSSVENKDDVILPKEAKKIFEKDKTKKTSTEPNNKIQSHGRRSADLNTKNAENNITNQNITARTTIEIRNTQSDIVDKEQPFLGETSNNTDTEPDLKSAKLVAASNTRLTRPRRMAPEPPGNTQTKNGIPPSAAPRIQLKEDQNKNSSVSIISNEDSQTQSPRDITPPSKRSHSNDTGTINEPPPKKVIEDDSESQEQPVKGIPSIIAQRLKQPNLNPSEAASDSLSISDTSISYHNTDNNPYSQTLLTPSGTNKASPDNAQKDTLSSEIENEITLVRRKMEANRSKSGGPAQIFDSSQLSKKKKNKQAPSGGLVPPLDLTVITDEIMNYQPQLTKVQPCNIVFIGENAKTSRSLLDKKRKIKISIHFDDQKTETFEYPSENIALEEYLEDHPNERDEVVVLEDFSGTNGDSMESSDDMEIDIYLTTSPVKDNLLTSNTSLSHSGNFQSYRGRYQQEYQFGTALVEQPKEFVDPEQPQNPEKQMLRPAEEDDTNTWSTSDSSDLLF